MVNEVLIDELKTIFKESGYDLPISEVSEIGDSLVNFFELLGRINLEHPGGDVIAPKYWGKIDGRSTLTKL